MGLRALVVDYGGVLTSPLQETMSAWADADEVDLQQFRAVMRDWLGPAYGEEAGVNPIHALERGEMEVPDFERELGARLRTRGGEPVPAGGLLTRMFDGFRREAVMVEAVRRARQAGVATALLSNSWGLDYPREGWDELFDVTVISGEVGMRKPEPAIYRLAADRLGVPTEECVFVDDLPVNVRGAEGVGMVGVRHESPAATLAELEALLGVRLGA